MKSSLLRGRRGAAMTAVGVFSGDLVWVTTSLLGLTALLVAYRPAFEVLRFVGAAYLIYLGVRLLLRRGSDPLAVPPPRGAARPPRAPGAGFGRGRPVRALEPKDAGGLPGRHPAVRARGRRPGR